MAEARIPVDLTNPGQVFACLGLMEAAEVLLGDASGGFEWDDGGTTFAVAARGDRSPIEMVVEFLLGANVVPLAPETVDGPWPTNAEFTRMFPAHPTQLRKSDGKDYSASALPFALTNGTDRLTVSSWLEGDGREALKLFAGRQIAAQLMENMLVGDPKEKASIGLRHLEDRLRETSFGDPFAERHFAGPRAIAGPLGGRFGYDARGAWDAIRIGTSLDRQGILVRASPLVEILAPIGLQYGRPVFPSPYQIRYAAWQQVLPISLARVALAMPEAILPTEQCRFFRAHLGNDKQYKKCFPATEEPHR